MSDTHNLPDIKGVKDEHDIIVEKNDKDELMEQVIHMDLVTTPAVEAPTIQKDYANLPSQEKIIEQGKQAIEERIGVKVNATIKKARSANKRIKNAEELDGLAAAQGTPIPDYWSDHFKIMQEQNAAILKAMDDIKTYRAEAAPLQDVQLVPSSMKVEMLEDPYDPNAFHQSITQAIPAAIPISEVPTSNKTSAEPTPMEKEEMSYKDRFARTFKAQFSLVNNAVQKRADSDVTMGRKPSSSKNEIYF